MDATILAELRKWKKRKIIDQHIQLSCVPKMIESGNIAFKIISIDRKRWMCVNKDTMSPVVFTFPVCWHFNTNLTAGNYLPEDVQKPPKTPNWAVHRSLSTYLSKIVYMFDVTLDDSFMRHISQIESLLRKDQNFNIASKPRKSWQNGSTKDGKYQIEHKLFTRCNDRNPYREIPDEELTGVHHWLVDAIRGQKEHTFNVNVPFPCYLNLSGNGPPTSILEEDPPTFFRGDVVMITFRLGFIIGENDWYPDILPEEFVRVWKAPREDPDRYIVTNWPARDATIQRLQPGTNLTTEVFEEPSTDDEGPQDNGDSDDDRLSQHSAQSVKLRIAASGDIDSQTSMEAGATAGSGPHHVEETSEDGLGNVPSAPALPETNSAEVKAPESKTADVVVSGCNADANPAEVAVPESDTPEVAATESDTPESVLLKQAEERNGKIKAKPQRWPPTRRLARNK